MTNPLAPEIAIEDMLKLGSGFIKFSAFAKPKHIPLEEVFVKPELPDCRVCDFYKVHTYLYKPVTKPICLIVGSGCTNGSEFKPAEPIRLYTITEEK